MTINSGHAQTQGGAEFLIIAPDSFCNDLIPFADWKTRKGIITKIVSTSTTGNSAGAIKQYIQNAYNSWQIRPRYLLIAGGPNIIPYGTVNNVYTDNYYTNMDADLENEIIPGRIPARNRTQLLAAINKILNYERNPYVDDSTWFLKGTIIVRADYDASDTIYWNDARYVSSLMRNAGFLQIDTLSNIYGNNATDIHNRINQGRAFVLYRGQGVGNWYQPFAVNPDILTNGYKLPIIASITCRTIDYTSTGTPTSIENFLLTGSTSIIRGGVGVCATTTVRVNAAQYRSILANVTFSSIFNGKTFGEACEDARIKLNQLYPGDPDVLGFTCLGDPTMRPWTGIPKRISVIHPTEIIFDSVQNITILVKCDSIPIESAFVCLIQDTSLYIRGYTNSHGEFTTDLRPMSINTLRITVTGRNIFPYEDSINIITSSTPYPVYSGCRYEDLDNYNQEVEPGEAFLLWVKLRNYGDFVPFIEGAISSSNQGIFISDSISYFTDLQPLVYVENQKPYVVQVSNSYSQNNIPFTLTLRDATGNIWNYQFQIPVLLPQSIVTGPDSYGYYAYDNTDTIIPIAPRFEWLEIGNGLGTIVPRVSDADADTITISLPFIFKFYGIDYNSIGISSNGYIEMGSPTARVTGTNYPIPTAGGPRRFAVPFWDDLNPQAYGDIYQYYDTVNKRFIIEFKDCAHYGNTSSRETFQVILLDPAWYTTPTADGKVIFQYLSVSDPTSCTVGIEDQTETRGLQYLYNGNYSTGTAPIVPGRSILITTEPPPTQITPWIVMESYTVHDENTGGNGNGVPEPGETVELVLKLKNYGELPIQNLSLALVGPEEVFIIDGSTNISLLNPGEEYENTSDPFVIYINPDFNGPYIGLVVEIRGLDSSYFTRRYFNLHIGTSSKISEKFEPLQFLGISQNPFISQLTLIFFNNSLNTPLEIKIFDISGRLVKTIKKELPSNKSMITWNGKDEYGSEVKPGVYFVKISTPNFKKNLRVIKIK